MCRGVVYSRGDNNKKNHNKGGGYNCNLLFKEESTAPVTLSLSSPCRPRGDAVRACELCGSRASLYCQADEAFLCRECDRWVHGANFLARRHVRCFLCSACQRLTHRYLLGSSSVVVLPTVMVNNAGSGDDGDDQCEERDSTSSAVSSSGAIRRRPFLFL